MNKTYEENPFEDGEIAKQWINSVEGERGMIRDNESYPKLREWFNSTSKGIIVDIGAGQGVCSEKIEGYTKYIGIEPSSFLVERAKEKYTSEDKKFLIGNAYDLPLEDTSCDQAISLNVWFHLADIELASRELSRVLKSGGKFWIHTANSAYIEEWKNFYINPTIDEKKISGEVQIPINNLSKNIFYLHTNEEIEKALQDNNLVVERKIEMGKISETNMFVIFEGYKK